MKSDAKRTLNKVREVAVIVYELTTYFVPLLLLKLSMNNIISVNAMMAGTLCYLLPVVFHVGVFGDKPKLIVDKIMGYSVKN